MPVYEVEVARTDHFSVTVEADDESQARDMACETLAHMEDPVNSDLFSHCDGFESCGCELVNEMTLDDAKDAWRAGKSKRTAAAYMTALMEYENEGMIGDETFRNGLAEIMNWMEKETSG
jgi:hypothetical protein